MSSFGYLAKQRQAIQDMELAQRSLKGKPTTHHIGQKAYEALLSLLSEEQERHDSPLGLFVANSTKRDIKQKLKGVIEP